MDHGKFLQEQYSNYGKEVIFPNMAERVHMYKVILENPTAQVYSREMFSRDILWAFKYFFWVKEPRPLYLQWYGLKNADIPFILYPKQEEFVLTLCEHIESGKDILVDKSREQGATWMTMCVLLWYWLKDESGNDFLVGSRKLENVDKKGSQDTLFAKFRYNIDRLEKFGFTPEGFDRNKHDKVALITNPTNGNMINGEANNANFATSGRYKAIVADEFAKWDETDEAAYTSMGSSSLCRVIISTPYGMGRKFSRLRYDGTTKVFTLHWSDHPLHGAGKEMVEQHPFLPEKKNVYVSPWYMRECGRRSGNPEADIGQELDIDHLTAGTPYFRYQTAYIQKRFKELEASEFTGKRYEFIRQDTNEIELFEHSTGRFYVLEEPKPGWKYRYSISADIAEGLEHGDNSVFYVYDRVDGKDVAWFIGKVDTHVFALILVYFAEWYDFAYIAPECNNQGAAVLQSLKYRYPNIYHQEDFSKFVDVETVKLGWHTNVKSKPIMCSKLQNALTDEVDGINDMEFFNEALTFVSDGGTGKLGATAGNHDDRVIAQSIKWMLHEWLPAPVEIKAIENPYEGMPHFGNALMDDNDDIRNIWR